MSNSKERGIKALLNKSPIKRDVPEIIWEDIKPTHTGLWLDSWGEWDELEASDVFPIADLLSQERIAWLIDNIVRLLPEERDHNEQNAHWVDGYNFAIQQMRDALFNKDIED